VGLSNGLASTLCSRLSRQLTSATGDHAALLDTAILRTTFGTGVDQTMPLKSALLTVLSAKALLHHLLADHDESRLKTLDTVRTIHGILDRVGVDSIPQMDHVIGVSTGFLLSISILKRF
jgi:hypothetical protein